METTIVSKTLSIITDEDILAMINLPSKEELGFKQLVLKYQEVLYSHLKRMLDNHDDVNDVLQNTFIKVFRNVKNFEAKSKLYTWIYRIATNEAITYLNKKKRNRVDSLDDHTYLNDVKSDTLADAEQISLILQNAIAKLPDKQKTVFLLRYYEEMSYQDISEILGTSIGGLKASYHHAVKKIEVHIKAIEIV